MVMGIILVQSKLLFVCTFTCSTIAIMKIWAISSGLITTGQNVIFDPICGIQESIGINQNQWT